MKCPNCEATINVLPNDQSAWCERCGTTGQLMTTGHLRRIRIPTLTLQATPAEMHDAARRQHEGAGT